MDTPTIISLFYIAAVCIWRIKRDHDLQNIRARRFLKGVRYV